MPEKQHNVNRLAHKEVIQNWRHIYMGFSIVVTQFSVIYERPLYWTTLQFTI